MPSQTSALGPIAAGAGAVAGQLALDALALREGGLVDQTWLAGHVAGHRRDALVHRAVAVVVEAVADLGHRRGVAGAEALGHAGRDAAADGHCFAGREAALGAGAVGRRREAAGDGRHAVVRDAVAVVVTAVADLRAGNAAAGAGAEGHAAAAGVVDDAVAVVVLVVAGLGQRAVQRGAALDLALVD